MNHLTELQHTVEELRALVQQLERSIAQVAQPLYETQPQLLHLAEPRVKGTRITCPADAYQLVRDMGALEQEELRLILLTVKNTVIDVQTVFRGTIDASLVNSRDIFRNALRRNAVNILIAHNHPSSHATPSSEDIQATQHIMQAGQCIGIPLLDHLVVGGDHFVSMKETGLMQCRDTDVIPFLMNDLP